MTATAKPPSGSVAAEGSAPGEKGLKANAISYVSNVVIATASTAPAYSLAATLGFIVAVPGIGLSAPAVLLVSFLPMLCIRGNFQIVHCVRSFRFPDVGRRSGRIGRI